MKKLLVFALVLAAAVAGCTSPETEKVQAIKFVPQEETTATK
jgi:hypothetical protein